MMESIAIIGHDMALTLGGLGCRGHAKPSPSIFYRSASPSLRQIKAVSQKSLSSGRGVVQRAGVYACHDLSPGSSKMCSARRAG